MVLRTKGRRVFALLANVCRIVLAVVLVVSGFVKAVDPMGTMYKLQEYVVSFGIDFLSDGWLLPIAIVHAALEFLAGVFLFMGVYRKPMAVLVFFMFLFFTPFTLYVALNDTVVGCGCFGDAIELTNWETFVKNLILLLFATIVFVGRRRFVCNMSSRNRWMMVIFSVLYISLVEGLSLNHLPVLDFRPYAIGNDLRAMVAGKDAAYDQIFFYGNDGEQRELEPDGIADESWMMADAHVALMGVRAGAVVEDFSILDWSNDYDVSADILADTGYVFVVAIELLEEAEVSRVDMLNDLYDFCFENNVPFYAVTASGDEEIDLWRKRTGAEYPVYWADAMLLRTMVRANPGVVLFKDGVVVGKWNVSDVPDVELFAKSPTGMPDKLVSLTGMMRGWYFWISVFFGPVLLMVLFDIVTGRSGKTGYRMSSGEGASLPQVVE